MLKLCVIKTKDNFEFQLGQRDSPSFLAIKICDLILEAIQIHSLFVCQRFLYHRKSYSLMVALSDFVISYYYTFTIHSFFSQVDGTR